MSKNTDLGSLVNYIKGQVTGRLNAPAYTSATAFTGTIAGYLGFDTSGNILTSAGAGISGSGATNYIPKWTAATSLGSSLIYDNGTNVAINNTAPLAMLHVSGNTIAALFTGTSSIADGYSGILISPREYQETGGQYCIELRATNTGSTPSFLNPRMDFLVQNNNTYLPASRTLKMSLTNNARLKIGTLNDYYSDSLVVFAGNASGEGGITIAASSTSSRDFLAFADGTSGEDRYRGLLGYNHSLDAMLFYTNANERLRINSGGNVAIGNTNNTYKLDVTGDVNISGTYRVNGTAIGGGVTGSGSTNFMPLWTSTTGLGNSIIYNNAGNLGINSTTNGYTLNAIRSASTAFNEVYRGSGSTVQIMTRFMQDESNNKGIAIGYFSYSASGIWSTNTGALRLGILVGSSYKTKIYLADNTIGMDLPTSGGGLSIGDLYNDGGTVKIVT
jgi:hypothetical protein